MKEPEKASFSISSTTICVFFSFSMSGNCPASTERYRARADRPSKSPGLQARTGSGVKPSTSFRPSSGRIMSCQHPPMNTAAISPLQAGLPPAVTWRFSQASRLARILDVSTPFRVSTQAA